MDHHQLFLFAAQRSGTGLSSLFKSRVRTCFLPEYDPPSEVPAFSSGKRGATPLSLASMLPLSHSLSMLFECGLCDLVLFLPWGGFKKRPVGWLSVLYVYLSACPSVKVIN